MITSMRAWVSSKFSQIWSGTTELAALKHLKNRCCPFFSFHSCGYTWVNSQVSIYRTIGPLVFAGIIRRTTGQHLQCIVACCPKMQLLKDIYENPLRQWFLLSLTLTSQWCWCEFDFQRTNTQKQTICRFANEKENQGTPEPSPEKTLSVLAKVYYAVIKRTLEWHIKQTINRTG